MMDSPWIFILFALALSFFYYRGVRAGHAQAKRQYEREIQRLVEEFYGVQEAWQHIVATYPEAEAAARQYIMMKAARKSAKDAWDDAVHKAEKCQTSRHTSPP